MKMKPPTGPKKNKPKTNPIQTQSKPVLSAVEKFLSLCPESVTIIRKSVIRQFKRGRLDWLFTNDAFWRVQHQIIPH